MRSRLLKIVDRMAGGIIASILPSPVHKTLAGPRRFLVIRPGGIGDAVLLIPALLALKQRFPGAELSILAERRNASAFSFCTAVDHLLLYDNPSHLLTAVCGRYDVVIDTEQWYRLSAVIARLTRAPVLIGFASNLRKRLFNRPAPYAQDCYEALSFYRLLEPLGITIPPRIDIPFLQLPPRASEASALLLAPLSGRPFVTIFPGASTTQKQWGTEKFRELVARLAELEIPVVLVGGTDTRLEAGEIAKGNQALDMTGAVSLEVSAAVIGKGRVLVSGDSGLLHIAAGLGTPTVSLFGPSDPRKWAPKGERDLVFSFDGPCAPCSRFGTIPPCNNNAECMGATAPSEVADAVLSLWKQ